MDQIIYEQQEPNNKPNIVSQTVLMWNTRGSAREVSSNNIVKMNRMGWTKITDKNIKPGDYHPAYDQGDEVDKQEIKQTIQRAQSLKGDMLKVIKI